MPMRKPSGTTFGIHPDQTPVQGGAKPPLCPDLNQREQSDDAVGNAGQNFAALIPAKVWAEQPLRSAKSVLARYALCFLATGVLCGLLGCATETGVAKNNKGVAISQLDDRLRVEINGNLFTEYHFKNVPRPFLYPLIGASGAGMTRNWPMKESPNEEHDHLHHRSFWFTHGDVNGHDFWTEHEGAGRIVHARFDEITSGKNAGVIKSRNNWVSKVGKIICTDEQTLRIYALPDHERLFDFQITLHADHGDLNLGDTKEGTMAIRVAETMRVEKPISTKGAKPSRGEGQIVNSDGLRDGAAWGKRANWCDYSGPVDGKMVGIAFFDHPENPNYPTWWMVREYGLFAANPFGRQAYENTPTKGDVKIPAGKSLTLRYRFFIHEGDEKQARVAQRYQEFLKASE